MVHKVPPERPGIKRPLGTDRVDSGGSGPYSLHGRRSIPLQGGGTMASRKDVLQLLAEHEVPSVLIGGLAMRIYRSPRFTSDMDLAIRSMDVDTVVGLMYVAGFSLVWKLDEKFLYMHPSPEAAAEWVDAAGVSSMTFMHGRARSGAHRLRLRDVKAATQVDFLFDLPVPFPRLRQRARMLPMGGRSVLVAAVEDLLELKERRAEKRDADRSDIEYLRGLLRKGRES